MSHGLLFIELTRLDCYFIELHDLLDYFPLPFTILSQIKFQTFSGFQFCMQYSSGCDIQNQ